MERTQTLLAAQQSALGTEGRGMHSRRPRGRILVLAQDRRALLSLVAQRVGDPSWALDVELGPSRRCPRRATSRGAPGSHGRGVRRASPPRTDGSGRRSSSCSDAEPGTMTVPAAEPRRGLPRRPSSVSSSSWSRGRSPRAGADASGKPTLKVEVGVAARGRARGVLMNTRTRYSSRPARTALAQAAVLEIGRRVRALGDLASGHATMNTAS